MADAVEPGPGDPAEWAIRWETTAATTVEGVARSLGVEKKTETFAVQYFRVLQPQAPEGYRWIVRTRKEIESGEAQTTAKLRGPGPFPRWQPPFPGTEAPSLEWDLSVGPEGLLPPVYSQSVTLKGRGALPPDWLTEPWGEPATMGRVKDKKKGVTVELWRVGGRRYVEISRRGRAGDGEDLTKWTAPARATAVPHADGMTHVVTATSAP